MEGGVAQPSQWWLGNVPPYLTEEALLAELAQYGVRPYKCILRCGRNQPPGSDCEVKASRLTSKHKVL